MQSRLKSKRSYRGKTAFVRTDSPAKQGVNDMNKKDVVQTKLKFESAYFLAKTEVPLGWFPKILSHEETHNVRLGNAHK